MIPRTPYQQFLPSRINKTKQRLQEMIWQVDSQTLTVRQSSITKQHRPLSEAESFTYKPVKMLPHTWGEAFDQCWWELDIPADSGKSRWLFWRDQGEATVYIDGKAHCGIDPGHLHAPLPTKLTRDGGLVRIESTCCRTGIWVSGSEQGIGPHGSIFSGAYLATRNDAAWQAYFDLEVLLDLALIDHRLAYPTDSDLPSSSGYRRPIREITPRFRLLIEQLDRACDAFDAEGPAALSRALKPLYKDLPAASDAIDVTLTGHAHIDLVWLWPERVGDFKAVHSFSNILNVQQRYPEMVFGYTQPASYEAVQKRQPELIGRVKQAIKKGRWEATGATYVESDVQLPCGEALVRAFELGQAGFEEVRGEPSRTVWIPDVFGYTGALPTIMAGFDVPYFYTTKMHWSSATEFPYSSFKWRGNDGSEVVSHLTFYHYNGTATPTELHNGSIKHRQSGVHREALLPQGYGDGGGGVNDAMCERARRAADLAGLPKAKWGTIEGFFDRLNEIRDDLPAWQGEMYLEYHRGVQTTHGNLKAAFRATERNLQAAEAASVVTGGGPVDLQPWKRIVFAQFHDYIPGSSIREVYDEHVPELEALAEQTAAMTRQTLEHSGEGEPAEPCIFNPLPIERLERVDNELCVLPPLTGTPLSKLEKVLPAPIKSSATRLTNGRINVAFNNRGEVTAMTVDGHEIDLKSPACAVWVFPDHPVTYDAWDVDRSTLSNGKRLDSKAKATVDNTDPLAPSIAFTRSFGKSSTISVKYHLRPGSPLLHIDVDLDFQDKQLLVKLAVPTGYMGINARFGAPFGSALRRQLSGPLTTDASFEVPGSRWAAVTDDTEQQGLMLITQAKYGFGCLDGLLHVSLARTAMVTPSRGGSTTTIGGKGAGDLDVADLGEHHIRLALGFYAADLPRPEQPAMLADTLFTPSIKYKGQAHDAGLLGLEGGDSLIPAWAKPLASAEGDGGWILRLHETLGRRGIARIKFKPGLQATPVNLKDEPIGEPLNPLGELHFGPYQIKSLLIAESDG